MVDPDSRETVPYLIIPDIGADYEPLRQPATGFAGDRAYVYEPHYMIAHFLHQ